MGTAVFCDTVTCSNPHDVNNRYPWSLASPFEAPDGAAFTDFLARLNGVPAVAAATVGEARGDPALDPTVCFAHHCDWHLPAIGELRTILTGLDAAPGQAACGPPGPCIDPDFDAVGGPTASVYWSASAEAGDPNNGWTADFDDGTVNSNPTTVDRSVRAVRAGSCN